MSTNKIKYAGANRPTEAIISDLKAGAIIRVRNERKADTLFSRLDYWLGEDGYTVKRGRGGYEVSILKQETATTTKGQSNRATTNKGEGR